MNQKRTSTAISKIPRHAYGHKCDIVFRQYDNSHNLPLEFGGSEAKPRIEEDCGTKFMQEGFIKLPRILKDMIDVLLKEIDHNNRSTAIRTVGILHSGLSCTMVELDRPTTYVSRVSRGKKIEIKKSWFDDIDHHLVFLGLLRDCERCAECCCEYPLCR